MITVVEILLIITVLSRTRVVEQFARALARKYRDERAALAVLCITSAFISIFMNNIGALALMFPVTLSVCSRLDIPAGRILMALSFSTLLGGICSLTGIPANLIVNDWKISETGGGFGYLEVARVGVPVAAAGIAWLVLASPRILGHIRSTSVVPPDVGPAAFVEEGLQVVRTTAR